MRTIARVSVTATLAAGGLVVAAPAAWAMPTWSIVPTPNPTANSVILNSVACTTATSCLAVGYIAEPGFGPDHVLAEAWNGTTWARVPVPVPGGTTSAQFFGVSCVGATCLAVGRYATTGASTPLAERYNGSSWTIVSPTTPPTGSGTLFSVSCSSATACTAAGFQGNPAQTLAERWNGTTWTLQPTIDPSGVFDDQFWGVSCPSDILCFAVGTDDASDGGHSIAEVWRNGSWHAVVVPEPVGASQSGLLGVDCGAPTRCQAVGFSIGATEPGLLAEQWNGTALTVEPVPGRAGYTGGELSGVSCSAGGSCRAVGEAENTDGLSQPVAVVLRAGSWSDQPVTNPVGTFQIVLAGVSCSAATACTAVGDEAPGTGGSLGLAERSSGNGWTPQRTPNAGGSLDSSLFSVSCAATDDCASVGQYFSTTEAPLAQNWDGAHWTFKSATGPVGTVSAQYQSVSCAASASCIAVGTSFDSHGNQRPLAATRAAAPFGYSVRALPIPGGATAADADGVSCVGSGFCSAVGFWFDSGANEHPLAEIYNGTTWTVQTVAEPATASGFSSVSCTSSSSCIAVGSDATGGPLAERWNGASWQLLSVPTPVGTTFGELSGVSCRTTTACTAVGITDVHSGALVESWNGSTWRVRPVTLPAGSSSAALNGVSCPSGTATCTAVGQVQTASGGVPLGVQGSGTSWTGTVLPAPAGAVSSSLSGVHCFSAADCQAVGEATDNQGIEATLAEHLH